MKHFYLMLSMLLAAIIGGAELAAQTPVVIKRDNGSPRGHDSTVIDFWEETVILPTAGPCSLTQLQIYFDGSAPGTDSIWIVGDPSAGALPPTSNVWSYNALAAPVVVNYDGRPGWDTIDVSALGVHYDGYDGIVIQHRLKENGPWFGVDADGTGSFSVTYDPFNYPPGFPVLGVYTLARGDYMVRAVVTYDYPSGNTSQKPPAATLVDVAKSIGITDAAGKVLKSARVSVADWNADGWDDIAVGGAFYQNRGDGTFQDVSATIGIAAGASVWGDYDNDGHIDCYAINGGDGDRIYHNNGNGTFTDVTAASGFSNPYPTVTPIWFDYNHDGLLDIFIANGRTESNGQEEYFPDQLWEGKGNGTFVRRTDESRMNIAEMAGSYGGDQYLDCWGASVTDYNQDGWTDIHVATYRLAPDLLFKNNHDGVFEEVGEITGVRGVATADPHYFGHGLGTEWADFDNDGDMDLAVGNLGHPDSRGSVSNPSLIFRNNGAPYYDFAEVHAGMGLKFFEMNAGVLWLDLDLDGYQDLWHCQYSYSAVGANGEPRRLSRMYLNEGPGKNFHLKDITWGTGPLVHGAWTAVRADIDRDGDMDIIVASPTDALKVFRNNVARRGRWLEFRLVGSPADKIPMDAYGTTVTVYSGDRKFLRELQGGGGGVTGSQNSNVLHFGVGDVAVVDSVVVRYQNGTARTFNQVATNASYTVPYTGGLTLTSGVSAGDASAAGLSIDGGAYDGGAFRFDLHGAIAGELRVEAVSSVGEVVASEALPHAAPGAVRLPISGKLPSGVYLIRVTSRSGSAVAKIEVVR
jgi:hypothetical protein